MSTKINKLAAAALPDLIDEKRLRCWLLNVFYSGQVKCPSCGSALVGKARETFLEYRRTCCRSCGKAIQFFQGTPLQYSRLTPQQYLVLAALAPAREELDQLLSAILGDNPVTENEV